MRSSFVPASQPNRLPASRERARLRRAQFECRPELLVLQHCETHVFAAENHVWLARGGDLGATVCCSRCLFIRAAVIVFTRPWHVICEWKFRSDVLCLHLFRLRLFVLLDTAESEITAACQARPQCTRSATPEGRARRDSRVNAPAAAVAQGAPGIQESANHMHSRPRPRAEPECVPSFRCRRCTPAHAAPTRRLGYRWSPCSPADLTAKPRQRTA